MNKKLAILIFAILTLGLIVILVVFYNMAGNVKINKQELLKQDYTVSNGVIDAKKLEKSGSWLSYRTESQQSLLGAALLKLIKTAVNVLPRGC